jgi:hypothetical protein
MLMFRQTDAAVRGVPATREGKPLPMRKRFKTTRLAPDSDANDEHASETDGETCQTSSWCLMSAAAPVSKSLIPVRQ